MVIENTSHTKTFITINIESKTFYDIIEKYKETFKDKNYFKLETLKENFTTTLSAEGFGFFNPKEKTDITDSILDLIERTIPINKDYKAKEAIIYDIVCSSKCILDDIEHCEAITKINSWEKDNINFDISCFDSKTRNKIKKAVASKNKCKVSEITEEMLNEYIKSKTVVKEFNYTYKKENNEESYSFSYTLI